MTKNEIARRMAHETARRIGESAGVRIDGALIGWMTPAGEFIPAATTTDERLARELREQGTDEDLIAEAQAQMQDAMDEMGCS